MSAVDILNRAAGHIADRAAARDKPEGERSMGRCVAAFNALTGHQLSERDGWLFMVTLKMARACNTPMGYNDDYEDGAAYFALAGEAARPIEILTPAKPDGEWIEWDPYTATGLPEVPEGMRIAWYRLQNGYEQMCRDPLMLDWGTLAPHDTRIVAYKLEPIA